MPGPEAEPAASEDLALLTEAAQEAGEIALRYWQQDPKVWEKPGEGPVTEADFAVDDALRARLMAARPDYGWLSEETDDDKARLGRDRVFIIDPIDGTRAYIAGEKTWAHSLAVVENGRVVAAVVSLPAHDKLYQARLGAGATLNGAAIAASTRADIDGAEVLAPRAALEPRHWKGGAVPPISRHLRPSLAYRLCLVAEGRFDAMLTLRPAWEWDVAAGALMVTEAGGRVSDRCMRPLRFNTARALLDGVIASAVPLHGALGAGLVGA